MRRPHVFERSAPRLSKEGYHEPARKAVAARTIAAQLGNMLDRATAADLPTLVGLLEAALVEAEKLAEN